MSSSANLLRIKELIKTYRNGILADSINRMGLSYKINYGVNVNDLKEIAQAFKGDHQLALMLFQEDARECKLLASMIDDPNQVTGEQIDQWSEEFTNTEIVEQVCSNLFWATEYALSRSIEWCLSDNELLNKAGLIIAGKRASDKTIKDSIFEPYLGTIESIAERGTDTTRSACAYALRQIGLRSDTLRAKVIETAEQLTQLNNESAGWIGSQILFEFTEE